MDEARTLHPRIVGTTFMYPGMSLEEGLENAARFGFTTVDVGIGGRNGHISPVEAARESKKWAAAVRQAVEIRNMAVHECFTLNFGPPINHPDQATRRETQCLFGGLAQFARNAGFASIMLIPGPVHQNLGRQGSLDLAVLALTPLVDIAAECGVFLHVEADSDSCANTPQAAEELCSRVPGLKLTLDYTHFIFTGHVQHEMECLHRFAGHVHVRQASVGRIVDHVNSGDIDFGRVFHSLESFGYDGRFGVEYLACSEADECGIDVALETPNAIALIEKVIGQSPNCNKV